jgi:DNA invertase Pin-like site-specific DNA recombinase
MSPKPRLARRDPSRSRVRVATYTRRSTGEANQPFTIEVQESKLGSYVASQDDWAIVARYSDDASGATIDRPDLGRALAAARAGEFDVLLVYRVDRFSRRIRDLVLLLDEFDSSGVVFRSATEPFDTATPVGRMLVHMLGVFAEFERDLIIDRVFSGMEKKASAGQWTLGIPPYGYAVDPATRRLRPVPEESTVVKEIFHLYTVRGMGTRAVANDLTRRGYRRRSGRPWSYKTVTDALRNPAYIGTIALRDVRAEGAHPAIIDRKTFALADALLTERGANRAKAASVASDYRLTGKIICPRCGRAYLGTTATGRHRPTVTTRATRATGTVRPAATRPGSTPTRSTTGSWRLCAISTGRERTSSPRRSPRRRTRSARPGTRSRPNFAPSAPPWPRRRPRSTGISPTTRPARSTRPSLNPVSSSSDVSYGIFVVVAMSCVCDSTTSRNISPTSISRR